MEMHIMKKQSILVLCLILLLLIMTVGYAIFEETLVISGTASGVGNFDVEFSEATVTKEIGSIGANTNISIDKNSLDINVPMLQYPGAYVEVTVGVKNNGGISAVLEGIDAEGLTSDPTVKISYEGLEELKSINMNQNDTQTFKIIIIWDKNSDQSSKEAKFSIKLLYKQSMF